MVNQRHRLLLAATRWSAASLTLAMLIGTISVGVGVAISSVALVGFGANSIFDGSASAMLVWRFRHERLREADASAIERRAGLVVGTALVGLALYLTVSAVRALADHSEPEVSGLSIALSATALLAFPVLARAKLRLAGPLGSRALRADGVLSFAGAVLAAATLFSLVLDAALGWWWADAVAAIFIAAMLMFEGTRTIASARSGGGEPPDLL